MQIAAFLNLRIIKTPDFASDRVLCTEKGRTRANQRL